MHRTCRVSVQSFYFDFALEVLNPKVRTALNRLLLAGFGLVPGFLSSKRPCMDMPTLSRHWNISGSSLQNELHGNAGGHQLPFLHWRKAFLAFSATCRHNAFRARKHVRAGQGSGVLECEGGRKVALNCASRRAKAEDALMWFSMSSPICEPGLLRSSRHMAR